jgi:hypothetical protein
VLELWRRCQVEVAGNKRRPVSFTVGGEKLKYVAMAELVEAALCSKGPHHHPASRYQQCEEQ